MLSSIKETIKGSKDIFGSVKGILEENSELQKKIDGFKREGLKIVKANLKSKVLFERGVRWLGRVSPGSNTYHTHYGSF